MESPTFKRRTFKAYAHTFSIARGETITQVKHANNTAAARNITLRTHPQWLCGEGEMRRANRRSCEAINKAINYLIEFNAPQTIDEVVDKAQTKKKR